MLVLNYGLVSSVANSPHLVETVRQLLAFISELEASLAHLQENTPTPEEAKALYDHGPRADRITHAFTDAAAFKSGWAKLRAISASKGEPK